MFVKLKTMEQIKSAVYEVVPQKVIANEDVRRVKYLSMDGLWLV